MPRTGKKPRPRRRATPTASVPRDLQPMESQPVDALPREDGWLFEPKYDGFRCIAFHDGEGVHLQSRKQKPLERYFPELVDGLRAAPDFVVDGEIIIPGEPFETLQLRLHPAASRIARLAAEFPATLVAFDLLADAAGHVLLERPFAERRAALEALFGDRPGTPALRLSKATRSAATARRWLATSGPALDGIMAKQLDLPYRPGERAMLKFKPRKTYDCVVGGLYWKDGTRRVESLLLGLYDGDGRLNYVGRIPVHASTAAITRMVTPLIGGPGFTGRAPGGKNRWSGRERSPVPVRPVLVAEVSADHVTSGHMRHGARLLRWRDDKAPKDCTMDQLG